jgi:nitrogen fixation protein FixH
MLKCLIHRQYSGAIFIYLIIKHVSKRQILINGHNIKGLGLWCLTSLSTVFQLYHGGQREPPTSHKSLTWRSERTTNQSQVTDMVVRENHRPVTSHWHGGQREPPTSHKSLTWRSERTTDQSQVTDMAVRENHRPVTSHWHGGQREPVTSHWHGGQREPPTSHKSLTWQSERTTDQSQVTDMVVRENHRPVTSHWQMK